MKLTLTALTVAATMFASSASAFEMNLTQTEEHRMTGTRMVGDLTVGVQALVSSYAYYICSLDGKLHLISSTAIATDPGNFRPHYKVQLEVDGEFTVTFGPKDNGDKRLPSFISRKCSEVSVTEPDATFIPIKSINGFTDSRSLFVDLINQGYE